MTIKKSNYGILKYMLNNEAMKTRNPSEETWLCWVPEINDFVAIPTDVKYYYEITRGIRFVPCMLDRKTKYNWDAEPLTENENELICKYIRTSRSLKAKKEMDKAKESKDAS